MEPILLRVPNVGVVNILEEIHRVPFSVITHACARESRFGGWTLADWSVAQHSILVGVIVEELGGNKQDILAALCHDLTEGCGLKDMPSPVKRLLYPGYHNLEDRVLVQLEKLIGFDSTRSCDIVKQADLLALRVEQVMLQNANLATETPFNLVECGTVILHETHGMSSADIGEAFADVIRSFTVDAACGDQDWLSK